MTDPIADFLTRIRNAYKARQTATTVPHSRLKHELAGILKNAGYLSHVDSKTEGNQKVLHLKLQYQGKFPALNGITRLSTPGRRLYTGSNNIKPVLSGQGITILSTPKGLMSDSEARKAHLGGELLCKVW